MEYQKLSTSELQERKRRMMRELIAIEEELQSRKKIGEEIFVFDTSTSRVKKSSRWEEMRLAKESENLTNGEIARYSRQLLLPEFGVKAQRKLRTSSALIVGAGGLGCPCAQYLVAAGVGRVGIVDHDVVDKSNLHRQVHQVSTCVFHLIRTPYTRCFSYVPEVLMPSKIDQKIYNGLPHIDKFFTRSLVLALPKLSRSPRRSPTSTQTSRLWRLWSV